jgi:uncharacterized protein DUF3306
MAEDKEGFLSRWSKRKQAQLSNPDMDTDEDIPAADAVEIDEEQLEAERSEAEVNRLAAEAVDLEKVEYGFDFSIFMKRGVPDLLRKKALQKFFNSNPVLANLDGLNDYDEDFNNPLHMVYKSSWDVGRGFLTEAEKLLQQATGRLTQDEPPPEVAAEDMPEELEADAAETAVSSDQGADADVPAAAGAGADVAEEADPADAQPETEQPGTEPPQQKRVSIRQRLNG